MRKRLHGLKSSPHQGHINYKGKSTDVTVETTSRYHLNRVIRENITKNGTNG